MSLTNIFFVWSDIVARHHYKGVRSQKGVELKHKSINKTACCLFLANEGRVIRHDNIHWSDVSLLRGDNVHLKNCGNCIFTNNLRRALHLFRRYPEELVYPQLMGIAFVGANLHTQIRLAKNVLRFMMILLTIRLSKRPSGTFGYNRFTIMAMLYINVDQGQGLSLVLGIYHG